MKDTIKRKTSLVKRTGREKVAETLEEKRDLSSEMQSVARL